MTVTCKGTVKNIQFGGIHSKLKVFLLFREFLFHNTGFLETDFFPFVSGFFRPEKAIKKKKNLRAKIKHIASNHPLPCCTYKR